jgi:hypothetical protein
MVLFNQNEVGVEESLWLIGFARHEEPLVGTEFPILDSYLI